MSLFEAEKVQYKHEQESLKPYGQIKSAACISYLLQLTGSARVRPGYWLEVMGVLQLSSAVISLELWQTGREAEWLFLEREKKNIIQYETNFV